MQCVGVFGQLVVARRDWIQAAVSSSGSPGTRFEIGT
jgi:hypothetical protein